MNFQKKYWSKNEYKKAEADDTCYEGYVGILDEKAYIYDTEEPLIQTDKYKAQINTSNNFFDRTLSHNLELPHKKNVLQFAANDFLYTSTVKDIIEKLQDNNNYIYRNAIISDTNLPSTENCQAIKSVSDGNVDIDNLLLVDNKNLMDNFYPKVDVEVIPKVIRKKTSELLDVAEEGIEFIDGNRHKDYLISDNTANDLAFHYDKLHPFFYDSKETAPTDKTFYYFKSYPNDTEIVTKVKNYTHADELEIGFPKHYLAYCFEIELTDGTRYIAKRDHEYYDGIKYKDGDWVYTQKNPITNSYDYANNQWIVDAESGTITHGTATKGPATNASVKEKIYLFECYKDEDKPLGWDHRPLINNNYDYTDKDGNLYKFFNNQSASTMAKEMLADTSETNKKFANCISEFYNYNTRETYYKIRKKDENDNNDHYYFAKNKKLLRELIKEEGKDEKEELGGTITNDKAADAYKDTNGVGSITVTVTTPSNGNNSSTSKIPLTEFFYEYLESKNGDTARVFTDGTFKIDFSTEYKRFKGMVSDEANLEDLLKIEILGLIGDIKNPKYDTLATIEKLSDAIVNEDDTTVNEGEVIVDEKKVTFDKTTKVITVRVTKNEQVVGVFNTDKTGETNETVETSETIGNDYYLETYNLKITFGNMPSNSDFELLKTYKNIPFITKSQSKFYTYYDKNDSFRTSGKKYENYTFEGIQSLMDYGSLAYVNENNELIPPTLFDSYKENKEYKIHYPLATATAADVYESIKKINVSDGFNHIYPLIDFDDVVYDIDKDENGKIVNHPNPDYVENIYDITTYTVTEDGKIVKIYKKATEIYDELKEIYEELDTEILSESDTDEENTGEEKKEYDKIPRIETVSESIIKDDDVQYDLTKVVSAELYTYNYEGNNAKILLFLVFEDKVVITKLNYNSEDGKIKFDFGINESKTVKFSTIDPSNDTSLKFKKLSSIKAYKNFLYLCDETLNAVFQYNIEYLVSPIENEGFNVQSIRLINYLQGDGSKTDGIYFNRPTCVDVCEDRVYVLDRGNSCIKVYNQQLNYIKTLQNGYFSNHDIQSIAINPHETILSDGTKVDKDSLWIFSVNGLNFFLSIISNDEVVSYGQIEDIRVLDDTYSWTEEVKQVKFSFANSNYYYFCTTKRVYKFHVSKPYYPFASLSYYKQRSVISSMVWSRFNHKWGNIPEYFNSGELEKIKWDHFTPKSSAEVLKNRCFALCGSNEFEGDIIFHFGTLYDESAVEDYIRNNKANYANSSMTFEDIPTDKLKEFTKSIGLMLYNEKDSYISSLTNTDLTSYEKYSISENINDEYINPLTFNKLIYKVAFNLIQLKRNIIGNFRAATNLDNVIVYDNLLLDDYFDKLRMRNSDNYFIHDNEPISININRVFENILGVQEQIIKHMQTKFMSTQSFVNSTSRRI